MALQKKSRQHWRLVPCGYTVCRLSLAQLTASCLQIQGSGGHIIQGSFRSIHEHGAWQEAGSASLTHLTTGELPQHIPTVEPGGLFLLLTYVLLNCCGPLLRGSMASRSFCASYCCYLHMHKRVEIPISENMAPFLLDQPSLPLSTILGGFSMCTKTYLWWTESIIYYPNVLSTQLLLP